ncbi:cell division protein CrgA [Agromyces fucosus]
MFAGLPSARITRMARTKSSKPARAEQASGEEAPNPVWFKPVMFGFMLVGLAWIIVFYVSQGAFPIADLGSWNILIGFGIAFVGFLMTTRWR